MPRPHRVPRGVTDTRPRLGRLNDAPGVSIFRSQDRQSTRVIGRQFAYDAELLLRKRSGSAQHDEASPNERRRCRLTPCPRAPRRGGANFANRLTGDRQSTRSPKLRRRRTAMRTFGDQCGRQQRRDVTYADLVQGLVSLKMDTSARPVSLSSARTSGVETLARFCGSRDDPSGELLVSGAPSRLGAAPALRSQLPRQSLTSHRLATGLPLIYSTKVTAAIDPPLAK